MSVAILSMLRAFKSPDVFNPWTDRDPLDLDPYRAAEQRAARLALHFDVRPKFLLIGEAPGYQGCRFSGVPFTNESLVCKGLPRLGAWDRFTSRPRPWCEPSATIVWGALHELDIAAHTVMWNAFAFHPHKPGEPYSNRAPTKAELLANREILVAVHRHFAGALVVAVGKVAERTLRDLLIGIDATLRHPAMGGATEFRAGLRALAAA